MVEDIALRQLPTEVTVGHHYSTLIISTFPGSDHQKYVYKQSFDFFTDLDYLLAPLLDWGSGRFAGDRHA